MRTLEDLNPVGAIQVLEEYFGKSPTAEELNVPTDYTMWDFWLISHTFAALQVEVQALRNRVANLEKHNVVPVEG